MKPVALLFSLTSTCVFASTLILDDFSTGPLSLGVDSTRLVDSGLRVGTMVGGVSNVVLRALSTPSVGTALLKVQNGTATIENNSNVEVGAIFYYGHGLSGFLSAATDLNLSLKGTDRFQVSFAGSSEVSRFDIATHLRDGNGYDIMYQSHLIPAHKTTYTAEIKFDTFNPIQGQRFPIESELDAGYIYVLAGAGQRLTVTGIQAVPEPGSFVLLGLGASLAARRKLRARRGASNIPFLTLA